jgi:cell division septum initiation protein DivIVA
MGMVANPQRIASAFVVFVGPHGSVSGYARERGVSRQWVYREANWVADTLENSRQRQHLADLEAQVRQLHQQCQALKESLAQAVCLGEDKQAELACVGQAIGVSLPHCRQLLEVVMAKPPSVAKLGRWTQAAGVKAGALLTVMDKLTREQVREAAADEIYVKDPVLMVVEPESLCWTSGRLADTVDGATWAQEFGQMPNLEQVTRDGGKPLKFGAELANAARQEQGLEPFVDQGDHFHAMFHGGVGIRRAQALASKTMAAVEQAEKELQQCKQNVKSCTGAAARLRDAWKKAEAAMDEWIKLERIWEKTKTALPLFTPAGALNTRAQAAAVLAETLPQLPDNGFAKTKRQLEKPEMLAYLDRVQEKLKALPYPEEVKQAAVEQEGLRRRPELSQGESAAAAARRGVLLACAVLLHNAGAAGQQAVAAVRDVFRRAYRASSLVECINSVLRMQQARHRKMTQGLLDLKRLHWNCHTFRTGRRRGTSPYQRLGVPWPKELRWWELLKLTPEQLQEKLSTIKMAP